MNEKTNPNSRLHPAEAPDNRRAELPKSVRPFVSRTVLDLSTASDFYKKRADVATLLEGFVIRLPKFCYQLKNDFEAFFFGSLPLFLDGHPASPVNALSDALFYLGHQWAKIDGGNLPIGRIPEDGFLVDQWKGADDWNAFLVSNGCTGEIWWHNFGTDGKIRPWSGESIPGDFALRIDFSGDTRIPPCFAIRVSGEPASVLVQWWVTLHENNQPEHHAGSDKLRERAAAMLDSVIARLKTNLQLGQPGRGRPKENFGEQTAYLLDHKKKSIAWIANELCSMPKNANPMMRRQTFDRIRKAAHNYYANLGADYTKPIRTRVRQRIIRVPGNPNAVKSE